MLPSLSGLDKARDPGFDWQIVALNSW